MVCDWMYVEMSQVRKYPGDGATAKFAEELKSFDVSKGTIRFSYDQEIPEQLIVQISRWCYEAYKK